MKVEGYFAMTEQATTEMEENKEEGRQKKELVVNK